MIRRNVSKESSWDIEGASQDTGWPGDDERRNTASKAWPRILCAIAAGAILLQVAYVMPNRLFSEPVAPTHSAFTADVPLAGSEPRKDDGLQHAERMRKLKTEEEEERLRAHMSTKEAAGVRKIETMAGREQPICTDSKIECREWAQHGECSKNWHFMHLECQLSCSLLPGYASAFACRPPTSAEAAADTANAEEAAKQQSARDAIKAADDAAAKARARVEAAAAAKKSRAAAEATRAEADAKRKAAADAAKAEEDAAAKQKAAADAAKAEEEHAAAKRKAAADAAKAEEDAAHARGRKAAADAAKAEEDAAAAAAAKNNAADDATPAACVDTSDKCAEWKGMGECDSNPKFMLHTCRKSCGKCELPPACVDLNNRCNEWTRSGECDRNPEFMLKTCRKSCGKCERSPTSATAK